MPSFLKDLNFRRKSTKASFKTGDSHSSSDSNSNNEGPPPAQKPLTQNANKSSSTLGSIFAGRSPPPQAQSPNLSLPGRSPSSNNLSTVGTHASNGSRTPPSLAGRPDMAHHSSSRYSIAGQSANGSVKPMSPLAPRVVSVSDGSWVHQKILLINGVVGELQKPLDGELTVCHHQDHFPPTAWPVSDSYFKALIVLQPGPNRLRLDFVPQQRRPSNDKALEVYSTFISINYLPMISAPPLHLAILVAKDSPRTFDAVPERVKLEGNSLETAIRKFRMAGYLWQAFTGEQMQRNGMGRRCFRFEEEWQAGTLHGSDMVTNVMRSEAKIHVITVDKTVQEIQDLDLAQQYGPAKRKGDLFSIAMDTCKAYFNVKPGQTQHVSCLYLDAHWDKHTGTVRAHAALGGGDNELKLAIFGSHLLQSYPAHIDEVVPAFSDCTKTDTNYVANDCNESGSSWEAANIGIGAHMHETGHLFGCPHQESGVMLRDYVRLNRTFTVREPYATRTQSRGLHPVLPQDECSWHRLDILRFRAHPCFTLPNDVPVLPEENIMVWAVDKGSALITSSTGITFVEIYTEGDELCRHWIEYIDKGGPSVAPRQITLTEQDLREKVGDANKNKKLRLKIFSLGQGEHEIEDFGRHVSKGAAIKLPGGGAGFRGSKLGSSQMDGTQPQELILQSTAEKHKLLTCVRVYSGFALDGLEFVFADGETRLFGKKGGKEGGDAFYLDASRKAEVISGFVIRSGAWIDGIQIVTNTGRRSEFFGNKQGGSQHTIFPPRGFTIAGFYGSCGQWLDGFGLIVTR
ncbi:hypothetical protein AAFC00_006562 [Neodothiora populina]|uniref:Jacalin-type lectin domain-containing protein n=1 Tax=Neodothiora populina TaxID=2781224 RepID=A0ABR3PAI3_9PEZI